MENNFKCVLVVDKKEFKILFNDTALANGFEKAYGGWFKESGECISVLSLQKSNFGDYFELNIKIFVQGMFGNKYSKNKELVKKEMGDIFRRQPPEYKDSLNFDKVMDDSVRREKLEKMFSEFITPFVDQALSRQGLRILAQKQIINLPPAIEKLL